MTKIEIELPDATAAAARDAGLLTSQALVAFDAYLATYNAGWLRQGPRH